MVAMVLYNSALGRVDMGPPFYGAYVADVKSREQVSVSLRGRQAGNTCTYRQTEDLGKTG